MFHRIYDRETVSSYSTGRKISYTLAAIVAAPKAHKPTIMLRMGILRNSKITYTAAAINP
jgi:hypothetical protein